MSTKKILQKFLIPHSNGDNHKWEKYLSKINDNILWFPESQGRFDPYVYFAFAKIDPEDKPSVFIHTDHLPDRSIIRLIREKHLDLEFGKIELDNVIPLECKWQYSFDYRNVHPIHRAMMAIHYGEEGYEMPDDILEGWIQNYLTPIDSTTLKKRYEEIGYVDFIEKAFLLEVSISYPTGINNEEVIDNRYILYFFHEQVEFFKNFIIKGNLPVKYLVAHLRGNYPWYSSRVFEFLLGYMNTKYLMTKFDHIETERIREFLNRADIQEFYNHPKNRPYALEYAVRDEFIESVFRVNYL